MIATCHSTQRENTSLVSVSSLGTIPRRHHRLLQTFVRTVLNLCTQHVPHENNIQQVLFDEVPQNGREGLQMVTTRAEFFGPVVRGYVVDDKQNCFRILAEESVKRAKCC